MPRGENPNSKESIKKIGKAHEFKKGYKRSKKSIAKQKKTCAEKRTFKELMALALSQQITDKNGDKMSAKEAMVIKAVVDAVKGDRFAREFCRDTAGEKPIERVMISEVSQEVIDEVEAIMNDNEETSG